MIFRVKNLLSEIFVSLRREIRLSAYQNNCYDLLWQRAAFESADFIEEFLPKVQIYRDRLGIWDAAIETIETLEIRVGLEFGVFEGKSINFFAKRAKGLKLYGFDSFRGLAENWGGTSKAKGHFNLEGALPRVEPNVVLVPGFFDETVNKFLDDHTLDSTLFIHLDCDTYESTRFVLNALPQCERILILYDDFLGYPGWKNGQYLAHIEYFAQKDYKVVPLGFANRPALFLIERELPY